MATKILLIGAPLSRNLGGPSLLVTTRAVLDKVFPDAEYTFISPLSEDIYLAESYSMQIISTAQMKQLVLAALAKRLLGITLGAPATKRVIKAYSESDIVIDIWGIGFSDSINRGTFRTCYLSGGRYLVGKILGKTVVKYTSDLGPFETRWNRFFSRIYFNHTVDLILARNETTKQRLLQLRVKTPIRVYPDTAFLLQAESSSLSEQLEKEKLNRAIIGFSISHMVARQSRDPEKYIKMMAQLADYIINSTGAKVIFIPNELSSDNLRDDDYYSRLVLNTMNRSDDAVVIPTAQYSAQQLKGIIKQCEVVVAARYHTIVASISQAIPVLAVGWHTKYEEILRLIGQESYICSAKSMDIADIKTKFDELWHLRNSIRDSIKDILPKIEQSIYQCADEIVFLLNQR